MPNSSSSAWWIFPLCILLFFCTPVRKAHASEDDYPYITSLAVEKNAKYLVVSCSVKNGLTPEIMNAIKSGITVIFNYDIELMIPGFIKDQTIVNKTLQKTIQFDSIKNEYRIMIKQNNTRIITTTDINDANDILFNINQYELAPIKLLEQGKIYKIKIRLYTDKIVTDLPLNTILNTFSNFGYKTKWYETNFQY